MCCTPQVGTVVAGVLCIFQCFFNLCWNVPLITELSLNKTIVLTLTPIDISELDHPFVIYGVTLLLSLVNVQLLIFSFLLFKANQNLRTDWIGTWCILVLLKSCINVLLGIYFIYEYGKDSVHRIAFFRLGVLLSGVFFFWPAVNICLFILVFRRYRDIINSRAATAREDPTPLQDDSQPPPYSPGTYVSRQQNRPIDPEQIAGWSQQPLLNFDRD